MNFLKVIYNIKSPFKVLYNSVNKRREKSFLFVYTLFIP